MRSRTFEDYSKMENESNDIQTSSLSDVSSESGSFFLQGKEKTLARWTTSLGDWNSLSFTSSYGYVEEGTIKTRVCYETRDKETNTSSNTMVTTYKSLTI